MVRNKNSKIVWEKIGKNKNFFVPEVVFATKIQAGTVSINSQGQVVLNGTFNWANRTFNVTLPPGEYIGSEPTQKLHFFWTGGDNYLERGSTVFIMTAPQTISGYIEDGTYDNFVIEPMIYLAPYNANQEYIKGEEQTYTIPVQQPMKSLKTVPDEFIQDTNGNYFERHNISTLIYTGASSEAWQYYQGIVFIDNSNIKAYSENGGMLLTNYFKPPACYIAHTTRQRLHINLTNAGLSDITSVSAWKTWLSTHNLVFQFELATPVDLPCTSEQIAILETLPTSYNKQTNIYSLDVTPAYIEAKALKGE